MKFTVSNTDLLRHVQSVQGVISGSSVLSILEDFLFEFKDGVLTITTSDMLTSMITRMNVDFKGDFQVAVPSKILLETLKQLPEQPLTIEIGDDDNKFHLVSSKGKYEIQGEDAEDFPKAREIEGENSFKIPAARLLHAINTTLFAVGVDELRQAMTGVLFELNLGNINFVSTDAHKLVLHKVDNESIGHSGSFIVPRKALNLLKSTLPHNDAEVDVRYDGVNAEFSFEDTSLICRLIEERFPDYNAVIPGDNQNKIEIGRTDLLNSLKLVALYANKTTRQVRLKIADNLMTIIAEDRDFSNSATEDLTCSYGGDALEIGFNAKFLIDMLSTLESDQIKFDLSTHSKPGLLFPIDQADGEDTLMLIMPVMLNPHG